jgi:threonylcarbamoyladenosine tRNA methylthiotransferase MtaB
MPYFRIVTFGCKVNQCDSAGMAQGLCSLGWRETPRGSAPDLHLVNTCTVTGRADQQARQAIRRLAREYPGVPIWVTGCYAQRAPQELAALPGVAAVLGNQKKARLAEIIKDFPGPSLVREFSPAAAFHPWPVWPVAGHTRAWLKIQEGCSHSCSYCIVPRVRGPRRSQTPAEVIGAFGEVAALGYRELVLTGVDLGQYGQDLQPATDLAALVRVLKSRSWPFRVRLSSLEPQEVTEALLSELAGWPGFCRHFHLPLQSGSTDVLRAMGRPYGPQDFADLVREITRRFPEAGLGLDVLVGFPGESAVDFEATRALVQSWPASYLHVFPFSPRPGTPAALRPRLPAAEVRQRAQIMRDLGREKKQQFLQSQLGQVREVIVEGPGPRRGWLKGLSDNYLRVIFLGPPEWQNHLVRVRLLKIAGEVLWGEGVDG